VTVGEPSPAGYGRRRVTVSRTVTSDPETVFAFVSDTRNDPLWCPNVTGVSQLEGDGVQMRSAFRFHQEVEMSGRTLESDVDVEIVELVKRSVRWRVEDRFQIRDVLVVVEADGEGSRVTQPTTAVFKRPPGIARWLYPMLARRTFRDQFDRLAEHFS
jgi:hypothetical protein